jgi:hypothetical protein
MFRFHTCGKDDVHLLTCNSIPKSARLQVTAPATFVTEQLRIACTQIILADSTALSPWKLKILQNYDENCLKDLERKFDFTADYVVIYCKAYIYDLDQIVRTKYSAASSYSSEV